MILLSAKSPAAATDVRCAAFAARLPSGAAGLVLPTAHVVSVGAPPSVRRLERLQVLVIPFQLNEAYGFVAATTASFRGGWPERTVGSVVMFQTLSAAMVVIPHLPDHIRLFEYVDGLPTDLASLAICVAVVLRSNRYWTFVAAASPLLSLVTRALRHLVGLSLWQYQSAQIVWFLVLATALFVGALTWRPAPGSGAA